MAISVSKETLPRLALCLACALVAATASVSLFVGSKPIVLALLAGILFAAAFMLSGNQRLFSLWGLLLTAPLGMQKAFLVHPHMGGASAITIDADDVFLALLLAFIARDWLAGRRRLRFAPLVVVCWGTMMLLGLADAALGPLRTYAVLELVRMAKCYLLFFVLINELVRPRQFLHAAAAIACGVLLQAVVTLVQYTFKANLGLQILGEPGQEAVQSATRSVYLGTADIYRAGGLFEHPNLLAGFMALLLPMLVALIFSRIAGPAKAVLAGIVSLGMVALVITLSRSGWMSFATGMALLFGASLLHPRVRARFLLTRVMVIVGVAVGVGLASPAIIKRVTNSDPGAVNFRYEMMDVAWSMVEANPVFGVGINSFTVHLPEYGTYGGPRGVEAKFGSLWPVVHNSYLVTWSEQGTAGFACLILLYLGTLWTGARTARTVIDDRLWAINLGVTCGVAAIMVDGMGSFFIDETASQRVFFMALALVFALRYWTRATLAARRRARPVAVAPRMAAEPVPA